MTEPDRGFLSDRLWYGQAQWFSNPIPLNTAILSMKSKHGISLQFSKQIKPLIPRTTCFYYNQKDLSCQQIMCLLLRLHGVQPTQLTCNGMADTANRTWKNTKIQSTWPVAQVQPSLGTSFDHDNWTSYSFKNIPLGCWTKEWLRCPQNSIYWTK